MINKLFVYGLLKKGYSLNKYLGHGQFLGKGILKDFDLYSCGSFPCVIEGKGQVKGEVYVFNYPQFIFILKYLDQIEAGFKRVVRTVNIDKKKYDCYVYVFDYLPIGWEQLKNGEF